MHRRFSVLLTTILAALALAPPVPAAVEGPCRASIAGEDVRNRQVGSRDLPITVSDTAPVSVSMRAERPIGRLKVHLEFAGYRWTVRDEATTGRSWSSEVPVDDYATYGVGLYKIVAESVGRGFTCEGAALVRVEGAALATVAGLAGIVAAGIGAIGVVFLVARGGEARGRPFAGILFGLLLGAGTGVLLQQFGVLYPTLIVSVLLVAGGVVVGFLAGMLGLRAPIE